MLSEGGTLVETGEKRVKGSQQRRKGTASCLMFDVMQPKARQAWFLGFQGISRIWARS